MSDLDRLSALLAEGWGEFEGDQVLALLPELIAVAQAVCRQKRKRPICKLCHMRWDAVGPAALGAWRHHAKCPMPALDAKLAKVLG